MRAAVFRQYGPPEVLHIEEIPKPVPKADEVLVKVHATTVTAGDWRMRKASPFAARIYNGLLRPKKVTVLGFEFAGVVEAVGENVQAIKTGERLFGQNGFLFGGYAEYLCLKQKNLIASIPGQVSYEQAAPLAIGATAALNHLRMANVENSRRVLINGASGSVGSYAVQLARYFGAEVTGVCSTANLEMVKALGAASVLDYKKQKVTEYGEKFDLIYDAVGPSVSGIKKAEFQRMLNPGGKYVNVEMSRKDKVEDLDYLAKLVAAGDLTSVIDKRYSLEEVAEAHRYVESGHKKGNVVINVIPSVN